MNNNERMEIISQLKNYIRIFYSNSDDARNCIVNEVSNFLTSWAILGTTTKEEYQLMKPIEFWAIYGRFSWFV